MVLSVALAAHRSVRALGHYVTVFEAIEAVPAFPAVGYSVLTRYERRTFVKLMSVRGLAQAADSRVARPYSFPFRP